MPLRAGTSRTRNFSYSKKSETKNCRTAFFPRAFRHTASSRTVCCAVIFLRRGHLETLTNPFFQPLRISKMHYVIKRDGRKQMMLFDKITHRIESLSYGLNREYVDPIDITKVVVQGIFDGITTSQLDEYAANVASTLSVEHPDYMVLAGRIAVSNLQKETSKKFSEVVETLYNNISYGEPKPLVSKDLYDVVMSNAKRLDDAIIHSRDFDFTYFGFRTLERAYLLKVDGKIVERPQFMFMRVALGIHMYDIDAAIETYNLMSERWFTHATPTLFNAGTPIPQLSSCFLLTMADDSIDGIYTTLKRCAMISKCAGGIGLNIHNIRAKGAKIGGNPDRSTGIVPMLKNFEMTAKYVDQGGRRPGAFAIYLEPWHADIFDFCELRLNVGPEDRRCRDLFTALWVPDIFMKRVQSDGMWSLMSPDECPGLPDCWGEEFEKLYEGYEAENRYRRQVRARDLWQAIIKSQCETGLPYMVYKDHCNRKSNQQNLGTIKCSNLCTEIIEYSSPDEVAVCNLASIALNRFVIIKDERNGNNSERSFDFQKLHDVTKVVAKNLNKVIDVNYYPIEEARKSNLRHRPIGIGVQGLADAFMLMRLPFTSDKAKLLNIQIFETIYHAALEASCELAKEFGPYETYEGSPMSKGQLQPDLWGVKPTDLWDWDSLRAKVAKYGCRNSLLVAPMPTASTAQILGNNEAFEPYTSNMYTRRVTKGDFQVVNQHLVRDLIAIGRWNKDMMYDIMRDNGSVQNLDLPEELKEIYKTVWEIKQLDLVRMAADRGPFIDQSQSLNVFIASPNYPKCTTLHFKAWEWGLKTGMYYLRSKPSVNPIKFTVPKTKVAATEEAEPSTTEEAANPPSSPTKSPKKAIVEEDDKENLKIPNARTILGLKDSNVEEEGEGCLMCSS
ncbi:unnamed protein product [Bursaphelenchus xylophilus]|uniref:Ribonucleoside-diphosphate reductase n=1 Tax=Bursaphelenchus xylophilus TaxID=6326 RepID=A0A1I7RX86_BURXY|nr:unnamed protein product [Bursaphelenchus xylophilus]CAG9121425.1 unnamed protein product [Bursaphelenchus xylophilus]